MIKFIICQGIGFSPGSVKYMPTFGFSIGAAALEGFAGKMGIIFDDEEDEP